MDRCANVACDFCLDYGEFSRRVFGGSRCWLTRCGRPRDFLEARKQSAIVMTKDSDFITLQTELGAPPKIIWITCGNTSNARLKEILTATLSNAISLLDAGEDLVEIKAS